MSLTRYARPASWRIPLLAVGVLALCGIARTATSQDSRGEISIVFDPALDEEVNRTLDASIQLELEHSDIDGGPDQRPRGDAMWFWQGLAEVGDAISVNWSGRFSEKTLFLDATRPLRFERSWDSLTLDLVRTGQYIREPRKVKLDSKLFCETILYEWKPKTGIYDTTRVGGTGKLGIDILESLRPLLPSVVLLADRIKPTESEWTVDPTEFVRSIWPGGFGTLRYGDEIGAFPFIELPPIPHAWTVDVLGDVSASVHAPRAGAEDRLNIMLEFNMSSQIEPAEWIVPDHMGRAWSEILEWVDFKGDGVTWNWKGTGAIWWSNTQRRMTSVALDGELSVVYELTAALNPFQPERHSEHDLGLREEWRGNARVLLTESE